jgi:predicted component of type VI protein secretion system
MNELTLQWQEAGQQKTKTIREQQPSKHYGVIRIGRDHGDCDLVLQHPTVSRSHVEIFFDQKQHSFCLRNLKVGNPPKIDGKPLIQGEVMLKQGSRIKLGEQEMMVIAIFIAPVSPPAPPPVTLPVNPAFGQAFIQPQPFPAPHNHPINPVYGLECPRCRRVVPYKLLEVGCHHCGTSLASAKSVLMPLNPP